MAIASATVVRRTFLRGALSLLGIAAGSAAAARTEPRVRRSRADILFDQAREQVGQHFARHGDVIIGPVSMLQRRFDLDYGPAVTLAERLEDARVWAVFHDSAGMRCARRVATA